MRQVRREQGQVTAMLVIFALILLLAIAAVTDISASYLRRQAVTNLADGAALAATDSAAAGVYGDPDADYVAIDPEAARLAVEEYLVVIGAYGDYPGLRADVAVEGYTVRVSLAVPFDLPVPVPGVDGVVIVHGDGSSVTPIYQ